MFLSMVRFYFYIKNRKPSPSSNFGSCTSDAALSAGRSDAGSGILQGGAGHRRPSLVDEGEREALRAGGARDCRELAADTLREAAADTCLLAIVARGAGIQARELLVQRLGVLAVLQSEGVRTG
jgi:hypothetical protein